MELSVELGWHSHPRALLAGGKVLKRELGVSGTLAGACKRSSCALQGRHLSDGLDPGINRALLAGGSYLQRMSSFFF